MLISCRILCGICGLLLTVAAGFGQGATAAAGAQPGAAAGGDDAAMHAAYDALFSTFLPVDEAPDAKSAGLLAAARDGIWREAGAAPQLRQMLAPFVDLRGFGGRCGLDTAAIGGDGARPFAALTAAQRQRVMVLLQGCAENDPRRLAATLRNFFIVKGYGAIQEPLTGVKVNLFAPQGYVEAHRPKLPASRLVMTGMAWTGQAGTGQDRDAQKKELKEKDGHAVDVLIVGSGPAGSVLAHELRRGGKRVLLVERGSFWVPGAMETRLVDDLIDTRSSMDGGIRIRNGMAVGGGTAVNVDLCFAPTTEAIRTKIEGWRRDGLIAKDEFTQAELGSAYAWVKERIGTRTLSESEINKNNHALWDGARAEGLHPKLYSLNTYAPGASPSPVTDKRSAEEGLLLEALEDQGNPLGLLPDAEVRRVLFEGADGKDKRAVGVEVAMRAPVSAPGVIADPNGLGLAVGQSFIVRAKTVILAAGALGSPVILMRSGVENDRLGRGVVLHPSMPIMGRFDHTIDAMEGTEASVYVDDRLVDRGYAMESMADQPLYAALMSPGPPMHSFAMIQEFRQLAGFGVMLIDTPRAENRIVLDEAGAVRIDYTLSEEDKKRFAEGVAEAVRVMFAAGAKEVYLPTTEDVLGVGGDVGMKPQVFKSADEAGLVAKNLKFIANRTVVTSAHMQGTDKMGATAGASVVGQDFHVWGTLGLYVVDGSVFPTSVGANPMQSIYTIAKIFADHWGGGEEKASSVADAVVGAGTEEAWVVK